MNFGWVFDTVQGETEATEAGFGLNPIDNTTNIPHTSS